MNSIVLDKIRVQALSYDIIRIEYDNDGCFEDRPTFFISERQNFIDDVKMTLCENGENFGVEIGDLQLLMRKHSVSCKSGRMAKRQKKASASSPIPIPRMAVPTQPAVFMRILLPVQAMWRTSSIGQLI